MNSNGLSPAQTERLAILAEECGEVIQLVGKILRFGLDSHHPADPETKNRDLLVSELTDVEAAIQLLTDARDVEAVDPDRVASARLRKLHISRHQR